MTWEHDTMLDNFTQTVALQHECSYPNIYFLLLRASEVGERGTCPRSEVRRGRPPDSRIKRTTQMIVSWGFRARQERGHFAPMKWPKWGKIKWPPPKKNKKTDVQQKFRTVYFVPRLRNESRLTYTKIKRSAAVCRGDAARRRRRQWQGWQWATLTHRWKSKRRQTDCPRSL